MSILDNTAEIMKLAPGAQFLADTQGSVQTVNANWSILTGLSEQDARQHGWLHSIHPDDRSDAKNAWLSQTDAVQAGNRTCVEFEVRYHRRLEDQTRWMRIEASPLRTAEGGVLGYYALCTDTTDLHHTHEELETRMTMLQMCDSLMNIGHWHVHAESGRLSWSDGVHRIHGTDSSTFRPKLADGINAYHPDDRELVTKAVEQAVQSGTPFTFEARLLRADGAVRQVHSVGQAVASNGGQRDIFGVFQDVTASRELIRRLAESEERYALAVTAAQDGLWTGRQKPGSCGGQSASWTS